MRTTFFCALLAAGCMSIGLAGCSGSDGNPVATAATSSDTSNSTTTANTGSGNLSSATPASLFATVQTLLGSSSDTAQPIALDAIDAGTADTEEPAPVS
jgi:ABC-type glycerol-3-phosphate transport system substrate-binding protein